jgi:hypothetical protein
MTKTGHRMIIELVALMLLCVFGFGLIVGRFLLS